MLANILEAAHDILLAGKNPTPSFNASLAPPFNGAPPGYACFCHESSAKRQGARVVRLTNPA